MEKPLPDAKAKQLEEAAIDFEAMFVAEMLRPMFDGIEVDPLFGGGKTEEIFSDFLRDEYGKMIAATGQLGIADQVKQQLIELQGRTVEASVAQNMHSHNSNTETGERNDTQGI
jgi:Rod binding domain-containing protein